MDNSRELTIAHILPEILNHVFTFLVVPPILNQFRLYSVGRSFWSSSLRDIKAVSSVCKLWRQESIDYLYEYITIYRPHHLKTLLESLQLNPQHARYIRRFEITAAGAVAKYNTFSKGPFLFVKLFQQCPNLTSLTIGPGARDWRDQAVTVLGWTVALAPISSQVTDLTLRADYLTSRKDFSEVLIALGENLTSLFIQSDTNSKNIKRDETGNQSGMYEVRLPVLRSLVLCCSSSLAAPLHWEMNSLCALTIHHDAVSAILSKHGDQLRYLCILSKDFPRDSIEKYCTSLQHLVMSSTEAPIPRAKHVDFWVDDAQPVLLPTAPVNSRYFDADLLHPEFGFPALPYLLPPTTWAQLEPDVTLVGGDSHCIQIADQGRVFTGTNCRLGSVRHLSTYPLSKVEETNEDMRSALRIEERREKWEKHGLWTAPLGLAGPVTEENSDSDLDSDWNSLITLSDIEYESDSESDSSELHVHFSADSFDT